MRLPSDGLAPLEARLWGSFLGRCVRRFIAMAGIDRCIVLSSQAFTALIPLLILVSTLAPVGDEDVVSRTVIRRFGLTGDSADAVTQLFDIPAGATTSSVSFFSGFLLLFSGISFTRRFQTMYRSAWEQNSTAVRNNLFAALGLVTLLAELLVLYGLQGLVRGLELGWLVSLPLSAITGLVVWTSIPYLLLNRAVHWRRLLFTGGLAAVCMSFYGLATTLYMPRLVDKYTSEFGLFGITIAIIGWLLAVSGVLVVSAVVGAELDASQDRWVLWLKTRFRLEDPGLERPAPVAVEDPSGLTPNDLVLLVRMLENSLVISAGVWVATALVPGIEVTGKFFTYLWVSLLLGLVNAVLGPLLRVIAFPLNVMTMGSVALLVNAVLLATTAGLSVHLSIDGFSTAVLAALVISLVTTVIELAIRPIREPSDESTPVG